eukprot:161175_1
MNLLSLFSLVLLFGTSLSLNTSYGINETLYEPPRINLKDTGSTLKLYVRLCNYNVSDDDGTLYISMTRYCYCTHEYDDNLCYFPGPTLEMHSDTQINITIVNQLVGSNSTNDISFHNQYKDPDVTNLHVHGLHVNPRVDDVLLQIQPGNNSLLYPYDIKFHYPGTHWYHAHHHGSTTYQVNAGLHGAILMTSDDPYETALSKYDETVLMFNWFYAIPASVCNNNTRGGIGNSMCNGTGSKQTGSERFLLFEASPGIPNANYAMCDIYCSLPTQQLATSEYVYDVETDIANSSSFYLPDGRNPVIKPKLLLFFTNGQISPIIRNLTVGIYHRLRFVNSLSNWYLQFKFPGEDCDWRLIATDGIYIGSVEYINYNLNHSSHENELIMSPGSRADVMVRCQRPDIYHVVSSKYNHTDPSLQNIKFRVPAGRILFSIDVNPKENGESYNGADTLPTQYATKPNGSYVQDLSGLTTSTGLQKKCVCNYKGAVEKNCHIEFSFTGGNNVNGKPFGYNKSSEYPHLRDALTIIEKNKSFEFTVDNQKGVAHVYHQHINPFQIPANTFIGKNGFIALPKTWWDSLGNNPLNPSEFITMRFWTRDYDGLIITHCHLLQHEDKGMMGFYDILDKDSYVCPYDDNVLANETNVISTTNAIPDTTYYTTSTDDSVDGAFSTTIINAVIISVCICAFMCD